MAAGSGVRVTRATTPTRDDNVHDLPVRVRTCFDCVFVAFGPQGTWCHVVNEHLLYELTEAQCETFEPVCE